LPAQALSQNCLGPGIRKRHDADDTMPFSQVRISSLLYPAIRRGFNLYAPRAAFALLVRAVKASGLWMAVSESILRFISMPESFKPCIKVE